MIRESSEHWILWLTERVGRLLTLFSLILLGLYLLGNFQDFLEQTQRALLRGLEYCCLVGGLAGLYSVVYHVGLLIARRRPALGRLLVSLLMVVYDFGIYGSLKLLAVWLR
jgi:hypothetical protein